MPGDTLIVTSSGDTVRVPDSLFHSTEARSTASNIATDAPDSSLLFFSAIGISLALIVASFLIVRGVRQFRRKKIHQEALAKVNAHYSQYDNLLTGYNGYYKSLSPALRQVFLERAVEFTELKHFEYMDIDRDEKMPLLISAAAIQLTFGLGKFLLDFFDTIYVLKHDYHYGLNATPFMGHVSKNGIYLSWDNFLKGFEDATDGNNVGIHEMAHALAYVNFMVEDEEAEDSAFRQRFREFSAIARPIFNGMQSGESNMLGSYAATNYNEFWAVAVENFFERSLQMKIELPQLYIALSYLLNQDPLLAEKLLHV
jgi:MtfA peptidase